MEVKCENCKYAVSNSGRPCREIVGRCSEYKEFVSVEEKPMEHQCKDCKHNHLNDGNEDVCSACSGHSDKFVSIEEKPMEKKYRVIKEFPTVSGFTRIGDIWNYHPGIKKYIDKNGLDYEIDLIENNPKWFEEVGTDMLESIIDENFIGDEIKKNLKQCIIKQKIELLKWAIQFVDNPKDRVTIDNKISELQKEIK